MKRRIYGLAFCLLPIASPRLTRLTCRFSRHDRPRPLSGTGPHATLASTSVGVELLRDNPLRRPPILTATTSIILSVFPAASAEFQHTQAAVRFSEGVRVGCRYETPQHWVFGIEGDFSGTSLQPQPHLGSRQYHGAFPGPEIRSPLAPIGNRP